MQFEVQIPLTHNPQQQETLVIEAPNWLVALRSGLKQLGDQAEVRNIACDIFGENDVRVTETKSGRTFEIREVRETAAIAATEVGVATAAPDLGSQTEAFIPSKGFFEAMAATAETKPATTAPQTPPNTAPAPLPPSMEPMPTSPEVTASALPSAPASSPGQPVGVSIPTTPPATVASVDDPPFEISQEAKPVVPSGDLLGDEDLSFNKTVAVIDQGSKAAVSTLANVAPIVSTPVAPVPVAPAPVPVVPAPVPVVPAPVPMTPLPPLPPLTPMETPAVPASALQPAPATPKPVAAAPAPPKPTPAPAKTSQPSLSIGGSVSGASGKYSPGMTTEILADAFMRAMDIYDYGEDRHAAMNFILGLAMSNVNAIGGAVLLTDINSPNQELWFEVTAGPKADQIVNFRIPMGRGIIGFAAREGVSLLIPDAVEDPRFETDVMKDVGITPGSVLCVPIQNNKRMLGAITLFNKTGERPFTQGELSITNYLAHTAGEYLIRLI